MKRNSMTQWINLYPNNSFINWTQLPWLCEKFGAILLVLVGLMAGRQSDEILVDFEIKFSIDHIVGIFTAFNEGTVLLPMHFSQHFRVKYIVRHVMEVCKSRTPCFFMSIPTIKYYCT